MKNIAIIFNQIPHGTAKGREALDAALALSDINLITVIFMADGVFHLLPYQQPDEILMRDYIATLAMLELYDINQVYACKQSLSERGLLSQPFVIKTNIVDGQSLATLLTQQDVILQF